MSRLSRALRASGVVLLTVGSAGVGIMVADAAVIPGAVTDVRIEETEANTWSQMRLHVDWKVPDGTAAGDTFTLRLPEELQATDGMRFSLKDEAGRVVANAVVADRLVTFTMTDYAEKHVGVHGSAWFWVSFSSVVKPGTDVSVVFEVGSKTFTDEITVTDPGPGDPGSASKWQAWMTSGGVRQDRFLWGITGPVVQENMVGSTYQIVDTPGPGQEIDCSEVSVWTGTVPWADQRWVAEDRWNLECTPLQASVTVKPTSQEVGRAFRLLGQSTVTDTTLGEYRNAGFVRLWGTATLPVSQVVRAGGGGDGTGTTPSPTTTPQPTVTVTNPASPGPTDNPTTTSPTANPTTTPQPTVTVTNPGSPVPTATVTQPGSPAPTMTVTNSAQPTLNPGTTPSTDDTVTVTSTPTPTSSGTSTPTTTAPGTTPTPTSTAPGTTPVPTTTVIQQAQPRTTPANPTRIDTGVPGEDLDMRLVGGGGALALLSGVGLVAVSRRRQVDES